MHINYVQTVLKDVKKVATGDKTKCFLFKSFCHKTFSISNFCFALLRVEISTPVAQYVVAYDLYAMPKCRRRLQQKAATFRLILKENSKNKFKPSYKKNNIYFVLAALTDPIQKVTNTFLFVLVRHYFFEILSRYACFLVWSPAQFVYVCAGRKVAL